MFVADPRITHLPAQRELVVSVAASLNKPHVAVPGKLPQEVQAYLVGMSTGQGVFGAFVYLFLTRTREAVVYVDHERLRVDAAQYPQAESDAMAFVESMGFMLEPIAFRSMPADQQAELMKNLPCFTKDLRPAGGPAAAEAATAERPDSPQQRLARLLAAY